MTSDKSTLSQTNVNCACWRASEASKTLLGAVSDMFVYIM